MDELSEESVSGDPFADFAAWYAEARAAHGEDADAMVVASADASGAPSARVVLLRGFDERGFCFFTNYDSRKGTELTVNPRAAAVWHWPKLQRQIRATGPVERVTGAESDAYWHRRPVASRLSAWASRQSQPVESRDALEAAKAEAVARFSGSDVARPDFWGGFRLVPLELELWLHRDDRFHDRVVYRRTTSDAPWTLRRLQP